MVAKKLFPAIVATFLVLTGCQWGNNDMNQDGNTPVDDTGTTSDNRNGFTQNVENENRFSVNNNEDNNQYEVSDEAAERIVSEIDEINQAYVLTTNNNAYVAATLDEDNNSPQNDSQNNNRNRTGNENMGINNRDTTDRAIDRATRDYDMDKGKRDRDIDRANRNSDSNRNPATNVRGMGESEELTDEVKERITAIVKDVDNDIDNVYVSTSPDFFSLTNNYVDDFQNGRPVEGFFEQMGNMIERMFPQNKQNQGNEQNRQHMPNQRNEQN